jgi:hypothetical protein
VMDVEAHIGEIDDDVAWLCRLRCDHPYSRMVGRSRVTRRVAPLGGRSVAPPAISWRYCCSLSTGDQGRCNMLSSFLRWALRGKQKRSFIRIGTKERTLSVVPPTIPSGAQTYSRALLALEWLITEPPQRSSQREISPGSALSQRVVFARRVHMQDSSQPMAIHLCAWALRYSSRSSLCRCT